MISNESFSLHISRKFTKWFASLQLYYVLFILDAQKAVEPTLLGILSFLHDLPCEQGIMAGYHRA
jgi:hypothetical protein